MIIMKQRKYIEICVNSVCVWKKKWEKEKRKKWEKKKDGRELQVVKFVVGHQKPTFVLFCNKVGVNTTYL